MEPYPRTWAEINFPAMAHNFRVIRSHIGPTPKIGLVCKADAYGHGLVPVGRFAARNGADWLCVASVQEGVALRDSGLDCPIMVMSPTLPVEAGQAIFYNLDVFVESSAAIQHYQTTAASQDRIARLHLKVDTGLHRFGCTPNQILSLTREIQSQSNLFLAGIAQHFLNSSSNPERTNAQLSTFHQSLTNLEVPEETLIHTANSAATALYPESRHSLVRVGMHAYGIDPDNLYQNQLIPVMRWFTRITSLRHVAPGETVSYNGTWQATTPSTIATLGVGYGDGYPRALSNKSEVFLQGQTVPQVGLVCMDQIMIEVTTVPNPQIGDVVELLGENIRVPTLARAADTNSHEIVTRLMTRVNRRYVY
ncbi:alanine racemase [bacterium]|nr:alanine racemase [bacterium]